MIHLKKIDHAINEAFDRIFPQDLTVRYLIGLGVVAGLSIFGQLLIQSSLTQQVRMQDQIRQLESILPPIEELKRVSLALQLTSRPQGMQTHASAIKMGAASIQISIPSSELPDELAFKLYSSHKELLRSSENILALLAHSRNRPIRATELALEADHLILAADETILSVKNVDFYLNAKHRRQVSEFQKTELILTFLTLITLILEALYIFRPAVRKLYESLQIRSDFLSRMSHEIRNPMNSIIGMANLLSETPINDQQKRYLTILTRSSRGLLDLLNNLLDFSSAESGKIKIESIPFDLHDVIERGLDLIVLGAQASGIELELDLSPDVPLKLLGDPSKLQQVLTNLLGNAVKFTKFGYVELKVTSENFGERSLISFSIIDTGVGIDAGRLPTIFDPFVQEDSSVKRRFGGSGLGLTISKQIVEKMGGTILVTSEKGQGSQFSFTLDLPVHEVFSLTRLIQNRPLGPFTVLFVKPESIETTILESFVTTCGGAFTRTESQDDLIEAIKEKNSRRLFIVDHELIRTQMPTLIQTLARTEFNANRLIFLIKTTATSEDLAKLGRVGIRNLLFKPVKPLRFFENLEVALSVVTETPKITASECVGQDYSEFHPHPLKILVVDDSHDNLTLMSLYLENTPHKVAYADNGRLAIQKFKGEGFDVVLMDLQMPEMDGYTATESIRTWEKSMGLKSIPIIALSAHEINHNPERFKSSGLTLQLVKPVDAKTILRVINETAGMQKANELDTNERIKNLEKKIASMAPAYIEKRKLELADMHRYVFERDFKALQIIGHRLKGNAKTYNFAVLSDIGAALEKSAEEQNLEQVQACVSRAEEFIKNA